MDISELEKLNRIKSLWRRADCVCFDVDSTVCINEAIDDLANIAQVGEQVKKLTLEAMGGNMSFREALSRRLSIIKPSLAMVNQLNESQSEHLTNNVKNLISHLQEKNVPVYLISGGFRIIINPIADLLNIKHENVFANTLIFDENGQYAGFDEHEMTSDSNGKSKVIEFLKKTHSYNSVVMIGDGATDLESCPPADGFIGFGGNVVREKVKESSDWFIYDFQELINEMNLNESNDKLTNKLTIIQNEVETNEHMK